MRLRNSKAATALVALALTGGAIVPAAAAQPPAVDGTWRVNGYGTVLRIADGRLQEYQTTSVSCLKGESAKQTGKGVFSADDGTLLTVRPAAGSLELSGSAGRRELRRIRALPQACKHPVPTDPVTTFDVFWQSFEENYPFFAAKGIDWHAVRDTYRPKVHADTSRDVLFSFFSDMVKPLYDAHVAVFDGERHFAGVRPGTAMPSDTLDARIKNHIVARDLKGGKPREFAEGRISYADLPDGLGYLRISGFGGYNKKDSSYAAQLAELDQALDAVLTTGRTASLTGLVIDVRINGGGSDALGVHIAERLTDTPYTAYRKRTRYTRPQPVPVRPAKGTPRYGGPVAVLTAGTTFSAGETFAQALIDRPGGTIRIGEPTQGVFSDTLDRVLPNGMAVWLPNEEFLTRSGQTFDGAGIPPHIRTPVFTEEEFAKNRDSAFDAAIAALRR
ncbi:S41 family peptidase [Streptomyces sp. NBC_01285]|uniref:S41 family peptidase n=1 Tax=Streptomyces sp. NBC_01285 TaxID=2903813 RepID=UPI00224CACF4|nr:S41 family peptidase [Streptomyces sp. NBC_01285]MCX4771360.1 S41 family peptidase [Streptomyces sp. NBC_01285]